MSIIDDRGRLFGRFNLIDTAVAVLLIVLLPIAYAGYALFRPPPMRIISVTPAQVVKGREARVQITGEHLRPYMRAEVGGAQPNRLLIQSPSQGEIILPELGPGTYDIALFDEAEEVARLKNALTIVPPPPPPPIALQLVGAFINLDEATARAIKPGGRFPQQGDPALEVLSSAAPLEDVRRIVLAPQSTIDAPVKAMWSVSATVRAPCAFSFDSLRCAFNGLLLGPGLMIPIADQARFLVREVRADSPGLPMEIAVRLVGRPEVIDLVKAGDVDALPGGGARAARIVSVTGRQTVAGESSMRTLADRQPFEVTLQAPDRVAVAEIVVRLVAEPGSDGPTYRASALKPGAPFTFDSPAYVARGSIVRSARLEK
jgi:hypothetical protein